MPGPVMIDQQRRVANSRYVEIPAAGHMSNLEQPAAFNEALLAFLRMCGETPWAASATGSWRGSRSRLT